MIRSDYRFAKCFSCGYSNSLRGFYQDLCDNQNIQIDLDYLDFFIDFKDPQKDYENIILDESILDGYSKNSPKIINYLKNRAEPIDSEYLDFPLYYDEEFENIACPVRDSQSRLQGMTGRNTSKNPQKHHHYFGMETTKALLGLDRVKHPTLLVLEGLTDHLNAEAKIKKLNLPISTVSTFTCSLSDWQAREITDLGKTTILCWDMDKAGMSRREAALKKLSSCMLTLDISWGYVNEQGNTKDIGDFCEAEFLESFSNLKINFLESF